MNCFVKTFKKQKSPKCLSSFIKKALGTACLGTQPPEKPNNGSPERGGRAGGCAGSPQTEGAAHSIQSTQNGLLGAEGPCGRSPDVICRAEARRI